MPTYPDCERSQPLGLTAPAIDWRPRPSGPKMQKTGACPVSAAVTGGSVQDLKRELRAVHELRDVSRHGRHRAVTRRDQDIVADPNAGVRRDRPGAGRRADHT